MLPIDRTKCYWHIKGTFALDTNRANRPTKDQPFIIPTDTVTLKANYQRLRQLHECLYIPIGS